MTADHLSSKIQYKKEYRSAIFVTPGTFQELRKMESSIAHFVTPLTTPELAKQDYERNVLTR